MKVVDRRGYRAAHLAISGVLVLAGLWLAAVAVHTFLARRRPDEPERT